MLANMRCALLRPESLTSRQLIEELRARRLGCSGLKPELVARLQAALSEPGADQRLRQPADNLASKKRASNTRRRPHPAEYTNDEDYR